MAIPDLQTLHLRSPARHPRPAQRHHHRARPARDRLRSLPGQAGCRRRPGGLGRHLQGRTRQARRRPQVPAQVRRRVARSGDALRRQRPLGRLSPPARQHPLPLHHPGLPRPLGHLAGRDREEVRRRPGRRARAAAKAAPSWRRRCPRRRRRSGLARAGDRRRSTARRPRRRRSASSSRPRSRPPMRRIRSRAAAPSTIANWRLSSIAPRPAIAAWYEMFPRSAGTDPTRGATFAEAAQRLPAIAAMGFDVVYLTAHPSRSAAPFARGRTTPSAPVPTTPASPMPSAARTAATTRSSRVSARSRTSGPSSPRPRAHGMEVALDFAIQASPDHPWAKEHPEWFTLRPDGTINYAENPPKKYQDIYPLNFDTPDWRELWQELKRVILFWVEQGVKTFRVDNPHTKSTAFWEWLIAEVQRDAPGRHLPLRGVHPPEGDEGARQSRLHPELHLLHLAQLQARAGGLLHRADPERDGRVLPRQPLSEHPRHPALHPAGGRPPRLQDALRPRRHPLLRLRHLLRLRALREHPGARHARSTSTPRSTSTRSGTGTGPATSSPTSPASTPSAAPHPALQRYDNLRFYPSDDENVIAYGKATPDGEDRVLVVVNLDPFDTHETWITLPLHGMGPRHRMSRSRSKTSSPARPISGTPASTSASIPTTNRPASTPSARSAA